MLISTSQHFLCLLITFVELVGGILGTTLEKDSDYLLSLKDFEKPLLFAPHRADGSGSVVLSMIMTAAYAYHRDWIYGGVFLMKGGGMIRHGENVALPMNFTFGSNMSMVFHREKIISILNRTVINVESVCPSVSGKLSLEELQPLSSELILFNSEHLSGELQEMLPHSLLSIDGGVSTKNVTELGSIMPSDFLISLRTHHKDDLKHSTCCIFKPNVLSVAIHIRRGDVGVDDKLRYTPNHYYINITERIRSVFPQADIHAFSSIEGHTTKKDFKPFQDAGIPVHFQVEFPILETWSHFINADMFIMAKSGFSQVPALLSENCVIYEPYHAGRLPNWITILQLTDEYIRSCYNSSSTTV